MATRAEESVLLLRKQFPPRPTVHVTVVQEGRGLSGSSPQIRLSVPTGLVVS